MELLINSFFQQMCAEDTVERVVSVHGLCPHGAGSFIRGLEEYSLLHLKRGKTIDALENPGFKSQLNQLLNIRQIHHSL